MVGDPSGGKGDKVGMLRLGPGAGDAGHDVDAGYETDGTAFSEGFTTEANTPTSEAQGLLLGAPAHAPCQLHNFAACCWVHCACQPASEPRSKKRRYPMCAYMCATT